VRTLPAGINTSTQETVVTPVYLLELGFDSVVRLCSRGVALYEGNNFSDASLNVTLTNPPQVEVFNETTTLGQVVLTEGTSGRTIKIWQSYLDTVASSYTLSEAVLVFSGEMGTATIGKSVRIECKQSGPKYTPRRYVQEPEFNHLPQEGTKIRTATQVITLE